MNMHVVILVLKFSILELGQAFLDHHSSENMIQLANEVVAWI